MKLKRIVLAILQSVLAVTCAFASDNHKKLSEPRIVQLPSDAVIEQCSVPVITSGGDVAFVSSVMSGALICFSVSSGKVLSSVSFGQVAGLVSMVEVDKRKLIALPNANDPGRGHPATISIIDAVEPEHPERVALVELPVEAHLTPTTRAQLTSDGRFGVVASSFNPPQLFSFSAETGKIVSTVNLPGWPSEIAMFDGRKTNSSSLIAIVSPEANSLSMVKLDQSGKLTVGKTFTHVGVRFDVSNNPAFSCDGGIVYAAYAEGEYLFAIDSQSGKALGLTRLSSAPHHITVTKDQTGADMIAVTRIGNATKKSSGVTILSYERGQFSVKSEFTPPDDIQFSRVSNVVFEGDASVAMIAAKGGLVFSFNTKSGELESYKSIGNDVRGFAINNTTHTLVGVRSTSKSDEIAVIGLELPDPKVSSASAPRVISKTAPEIRKVSTDATQLRVTIEGVNFNKGTTVEFVKAGDVVLRKTPVVVSDKLLYFTVPTKTLEALGKFDLRAVNTDKATSNAVAVEPFSVRLTLPVVSTLVARNPSTPEPSTSQTSEPDSQSSRPRTVQPEKTETEPIEKLATKSNQPQSTPGKAQAAAPVVEKPVMKPTQPAPAPEKTQIAATSVSKGRPSALKTASSVEGVSTVTNGGGLRVVIQTDGDAKFQDFVLTDPSRIVVDIQGVQNRLGNKVIAVKSDLVDRVRVGQPKAGVVRVVVDTSAAVDYTVSREGSALLVDVNPKMSKARP
jgi:hypothetical protein